MPGTWDVEGIIKNFFGALPLALLLHFVIRTATQSGFSLFVGTRLERAKSELAKELETAKTALARDLEAAKAEHARRLEELKAQRQRELKGYEAGLAKISDDASSTTRENFKTSRGTVRRDT
jgi:hypothetical protein